MRTYVGRRGVKRTRVRMYLALRGSEYNLRFWISTPVRCQIEVEVDLPVLNASLRLLLWYVSRFNALGLLTLCLILTTSSSQYVVHYYA
jgi:hypothetical protein